MHHLVQIWFQWVEQWGYLGIILLMAMESSIFPVPSEIVIPPAAFLASGGKIKHVRCHSGGHIRLVAWGHGDLLGCIVAWTRLHRSVGTLFFA